MWLRQNLIIKRLILNIGKNKIFRYILTIDDNWTKYKV